MEGKAMYESPIEFFTKTVAPKIAAEIDEKALEAVFQCGFNVGRDELEKALRYDRDQWRKGFADGVEHAQPKWISVEDRLPGTQHIMLVRTKNRNGVPKVAMASYHDGFGCTRYHNDEKIDAQIRAENGIKGACND
jgi:hypothetical protein